MVLKKSLAALFTTEPPDGTHLLVWRDSTPTVIWRCDRDAEGDRRWFDRHRRDDGNPMTFAVALSDADDVHALVSLDQSGRRATEKILACVSL